MVLESGVAAMATGNADHVWTTLPCLSSRAPAPVGDRQQQFDRWVRASRTPIKALTAMTSSRGIAEEVRHKIVRRLHRRASQMDCGKDAHMVWNIPTCGDGSCLPHGIECSHAPPGDDSHFLL